MPILSGGGAGGTTLGNVTTVTGTPTAGQVIVASSGTAAAWGNPALQLLCSQQLSGTQASFDTNTILGGNLPTAFNHLQVVVYGRCNGAGSQQGLLLTFNNDSTAGNYASQKVIGTAANATSAEALGTLSGVWIGQISGTAATASYAGQTNVDIPQYNATSLFKVAVARNLTTAGNTTGLLNDGVYGGVWENTAAITRVAVTPQAGSFVAGSWFAVYGV